MNDLIEPNFEIEVNGKEYIGRGSQVIEPSEAWVREKNIFYRCAQCGSFMQASFNDYYSCECNAMSLDVDYGRFGSTLGDQNILVYKIIKK